MNLEQYFDGISKSLSNAKDLFDDAEILFNLERYQRAYTLYQLSIEEIGKASLIYSFVLDKDYNNENEFKVFKKSFLSHKQKTVSSNGIDLIFSFLNNDVRIKKKLIYQYFLFDKHLSQLNDYKNRSLYTDISNNKFISPKETITKEITDEIKFVAEIRLNVAKVFLKVGMEEFDGIKKASKNLDTQSIIDNPPEEIIEFIKLKYGIELKKD
ncbi:AbiV family abortive infection protein [Gelidibacter sediminis]|uniref:AbiV family abortive infection protein n=1 Tax=Gelidibacter sediminis TaxID=1608710 RepID=A0A4R7PHC9_9FLAO|nr:AbiV family abortive infection protein [Gelidibacter sediminis]